MDETVGAQLWQLVGQDRNSTYPVTVEPRLLIRTLDELHRLETEVKALWQVLEQTRGELGHERRLSGGMQVDRDRLRARLATALELAEDGGVDIADEDIDECIAARQRDDDEEF